MSQIKVFGQVYASTLNHKTEIYLKKPVNLPFHAITFLDPFVSRQQNDSRSKDIANELLDPEKLLTMAATNLHGGEENLLVYN